jgi:hypothetical protein
MQIRPTSGDISGLKQKQRQRTVRERTDASSPRAVGVRKAVWLIFIGAVVLSLAMPVAVTIQQSTAALEVRVSVWPAHPQAGEAAHLVVSLVQSNDRAAARGPWAQLVATWDMTAMRMGTQQAVVQGAQNDNGELTVPLQLTMSGFWLVHATFQTPGRPTWHGTVQVMVAPATALKPPRGLTSSASGRIGSESLVQSGACSSVGEDLSV